MSNNRWEKQFVIDGHTVSLASNGLWWCDCPARKFHAKRYPVCAHAMMAMARSCYRISENIRMHAAALPFVCVVPETQDGATEILYPLVPISASQKMVATIVYDMLRAGATREMARDYVQHFSDSPPEAYISLVLREWRRMYEGYTLPAWTHIPVVTEMTDSGVEVVVHNGGKTDAEFVVMRFYGRKVTKSVFDWTGGLPDKIREFFLAPVDFWYSALAPSHRKLASSGETNATSMPEKANA